ncbi:hypothetical protein RHIZ404_200959 [Rhizobium sp. EC-SD404]|nr:hypothetical protein RHIZ404_200959 [Rhizobium sp. EC-SD404]
MADNAQTISNPRFPAPPIAGGMDDKVLRWSARADHLATGFMTLSNFNTALLLRCIINTPECAG